MFRACSILYVHLWVRHTSLQDLCLNPKNLLIYTRCWNQFTNFCSENNFLSLPASPSTIESFMMHHLSFKSMFTIPQFLAAISHFHAKSYLPSPFTSLSVTRALEGAKRSFGRPSIQRKIISPEMLRSLANLITPKFHFLDCALFGEFLSSFLVFFVLARSLL